MLLLLVCLSRCHYAHQHPSETFLCLLSRHATSCSREWRRAQETTDGHGTTAVPGGGATGQGKSGPKHVRFWEGSCGRLGRDVDEAVLSAKSQELRVPPPLAEKLEDSVSEWQATLRVRLEGCDSIGKRAKEFTNTSKEFRRMKAEVSDLLLKDLSTCLTQRFPSEDERNRVQNELAVGRHSCLCQPASMGWSCDLLFENSETGPRICFSYTT